MEVVGFDGIFWVVIARAYIYIYIRVLRCWDGLKEIKIFFWHKGGHKDKKKLSSDTTNLLRERERCGEGNRERWKILRGWRERKNGGMGEKRLKMGGDKEREETWESINLH